MRNGGCGGRGAGKDGALACASGWVVGSVWCWCHSPLARMDMGSFQAWHLVSPRRLLSVLPAVHSTATAPGPPTDRTGRQAEPSMPRNEMHWRMCGTWHRNPKQAPPIHSFIDLHCRCLCGPPSPSFSLPKPCLATSMIPFLSLSLSRTRGFCLTPARPQEKKRKSSCILRLELHDWPSCS